MKTTERRTRKKSRGKDIFYWSIIAFPVLQFLIFYVGVNINSFALSFETFDYSKGFSFVGIENLFSNFINVFNKISANIFRSAKIRKVNGQQTTDNRFFYNKSL